MTDLLETVRQSLELTTPASARGRRFVLSLSGGSDSTVLFHILYRLQKDYPFQWRAVHFNFHLRGAASQGDEEFVRRLCATHDILLEVVSIRMKKGTKIQEEARSKRLLEISRLSLSHEEWLEAHHADDQLETFLFKLCRGSGVTGAGGMREKKFREGLWVRRPLLSIRKETINAYARKNRIRSRLDRSNLKTDYDRNFIRLKILPMIEKRFPHAGESFLRFMQHAREWDDYFHGLSEKTAGRIVTNTSSYIWRWDELASLSRVELIEFIHRIYRRDWKTTLSAKQTKELAEKIMQGRDFTFNAPQGVIVRGRSGAKGSQILFKARSE